MEKNPMQEAGERMLLLLVDMQKTIETEAERLKPKKAKKMSGGTSISNCTCPTCGEYAFHSIWNEDVTYCCICGQAIDWKRE